MKYFPFFLFILLSYACKEIAIQPKEIVQEKTIENKPTRLDSLEMLSIKMFQKDPIKSIPFYNEMANIYGRQNMKVEQANVHLNISNIYNDYTNNVKKASHHGHMSLGLWEQLRDTIHMANLFNYCGYLSAKEGNVDFGKMQLNKAEQLYIGLGNSQGKAITYFNMARVFLMARDYVKAEQFFMLSKKYWTDNFNAERLFELNNFAIKMFKKIKKTDDVKKAIKENDQILKEHHIGPLLEAAFKKLTS